MKEKYKVLFRNSVKKDFDKIPKKDLRKVLKLISSLSDNPRPSGVRKLSGEDKYRLRKGNHRIIYSIQDSELTVWVVKVGHRKNIYR